MVMVTANRSIHSTVAPLIGCAILFAAGCASEARRHPERVYDRCTTLRHKGKVAEALQLADEALGDWSRKPESQWYWRFRLLDAELHLLRPDVAVASKLLNGEPPASLPDRDRIVARLLAARASLAETSKDLPQAIDLWGRAYTLAREKGLTDLIPSILNARGSRYATAGQFDKADADLRTAIALAEQRGMRYFLAAALANMGYNMLQQYRYDETLDWSGRALAIAQQDGLDGLIASIQVNTSWSFYRLGDLDKAGETFKAAASALEKIGFRVNWLTAVGNIGNFYLSLGQNREAIPYFEKAYQAATDLKRDSERATWLNNIAMAYLELGELDKAEEFNRRAGELYPAKSSSRVWPLLNGARIAIARQNHHEAWRLYEEALRMETDDPYLQWETRAGIAELCFAENDLARARIETARAIAIVDESWSNLSNQKSKLTFQSRMARFSQTYVDFLMAHDCAAEALEFVESRRARLLAEKRRLTGENNVSDLPGLARRTHAILLSYWLGPKQSYVWAVTPRGIRSFVLPREQQIREAVESYRAAIMSRREVRLAEHPSARSLYDLLIAPARDLLPPGSNVILVPDGCLHNLSFDTLATPDGHYWVEEAQVEVAPSLRLIGSEPRNFRAEGGILIIGDPADSGSGLPRLHSAANEIAQISDLFPEKQVIAREAACPESYRAANPQRFGVIHFAAHAVANPENPLESAVILAKGQEGYKLYAREVQEVPIGARLVTVSACQSAGGRPFLGEGLVGFAWAFLGAGAQQVVASLWEVPDQSTTAFMRSFYRHIRGSEPPATALRNVKLEFLRSGDATQKPYYWAAFQVYTR